MPHENRLRFALVSAAHAEIDALRAASRGLVKCETCGEVAKPDMGKPCIEPHGETTYEPTCIHCGSEWINEWPQE